MNQNFSNQFPLIFADEKPALLTTVVNMLRQKGYIVIRWNLLPSSQKPIFTFETEEVMRLDGLNILRFVTSNWTKEIPVVILQTTKVEKNSVIPMVA